MEADNYVYVSYPIDTDHSRNIKMKLFIVLTFFSFGFIGVSSQGGGEDEHHEERREHGIGWGGSKFITPVDVHHEEVVHLKAHPEFHYDYRVADHKHKDYHQKHEERKGYKVKGSYSLLEPDHKTVRVVDYTSDKKRGWVAKVHWRKHDE